MAPTNSPLTLENLAETLRAYGEATDRRLEALAERIDSLGEATDRRLHALADRMEALGEATDRRLHALAERMDALTLRVEDLTGQIEGVLGLIRDIGRFQVSQSEELREHREQIRQILHRLEQHDARLEDQGAAIRRILDLLERRWGGDGGRPSA
jgi:chromosome segregation ATPase